MRLQELDFANEMVVRSRNASQNPLVVSRPQHQVSYLRKLSYGLKIMFISSGRLAIRTGTVGPKYQT
jgi:hypothetical protein